MSKLEYSVLFVCFGNIIRSPMAESVFKKLLEERALSSKWRADSAGVGSWYVGMDPDPRTIHVLKSRHYDIVKKARQVGHSDFFEFHYILAMDDEVLFDLGRMTPQGATAKQQLLGDYDPTGEIFIDDPYHTKGDKEFYKILDQCKRCCEEFLKRVMKRQ